MAQKNVLGKGLGAIFPDLLNDFDKKKSVFSCGIEELRPNRYQPRKSFNDITQKQLIASIKNSGIISDSKGRQGKYLGIFYFVYFFIT